MAFGLGPAKVFLSPENRGHRLLTALPRLRALRWGQQVHGRLVVSMASENGRSLTGATCVGRCDALITAETGVGLMVWTADCVPILLEGDGVIASVHSGWRGTAADIIGAVIRRFETEFGVAAPRLRAVLGPAVSGPRYEVGPKVVEALAAIGVDHQEWKNAEHVDLRAFLMKRLRQLGLQSSSISKIGPCTASDPRLASYRRDGPSSGRQFSLIYRVATSPGDELAGLEIDRRPRS